MGANQEPDSIQATPIATASDKHDFIQPDISIVPAPESAECETLLIHSTSQESIASNVASYLHTPAEPYEEQGALAIASGSKDMLHAAVLNSRAMASAEASR
ncbi:hypothetical protein EV174_006416, partial [Coemansia sp. RSA 2320]